MQEPDLFEQRYGSRDSQLQQLREALVVRVFGPYGGTCSDILKEATSTLRDEGYNVKLCIEANEISHLKPMTEIEEGTPEYNFEASLECIRQADVGVFVFMKAKRRRFLNRLLKATSKRNALPQDMNSSVVLELSKWTSQTSRSDDCFVIYENNKSHPIGSLIPGAVTSQELCSWEIETTHRQSAVEAIVNVIRGRCRGWIDQFEPQLQERV
jgi:hypothetical protein